MARVLLTTLTLLVVLPGTAAACSLAGPVPGPGHFFLYEPATGDEIEIPVHQRSLGGTCDLSNPFAYDGKRFAWVEGPETYSDSKPDTVYLYDVAADATTEPKLTGLRHERLSLADEYLIHLSSGKLYRYRFSTGIDQIVPIALTGQPLMWDTQIAWQRNDAAQNRFISVYDAATSHYVLREKTPAQLGVPDEANLMSFGDGWLLFSSYDGQQDEWWSYRISSQEAERLPGFESNWPPPGEIHDGRVYTLKWDDGYDEQTLVAHALPDGKTTELGTVPHEAASRLVVVDRKVVLGSYSNVDAHTHEASGPAAGPGGPGVARTISRPPPSDQTIWAVPNAGLPSAALVLVAVVVLRRWL